MIDNLTYIEAQTFSMVVMVMVGVMVVMVMMTVVIVAVMMMMIELLLMMDNLTDIEAHTRFIDLKLQQSRRLCCIPDNVVADKNYFFVLLESVDALSKADDCVSGNVLSQTRINLSRV